MVDYSKPRNAVLTYPVDDSAIYVTPQLQKFIEELRLPKELILHLDELKHFNVDNPIESKEVCRGVYSLYQMLCQARFHLASSQLKSYPDFLADGSSQESHLRISTWFLNNAIIEYQSAFDLLLQILWIGNGIYKKLNKYRNAGITTENIQKILEDCRWCIIRDNKEFMEQSFFSQLKSFWEKNNKVNNAANTLEHRQFVNYTELNYKESIAILYPEYDQTKTLYSTSIDEMIDDLKKYHSEFIELVKLLPFL